MSKYYIQVNKDGKPLEGGVVSKRRPKYGLYQAIESLCCNLFPALINNDGSAYTPPGVFNGDSIRVQLNYQRAGETSDMSIGMSVYFPGRTTFTLTEVINILNDRFSMYGVWERDKTLGVKLVETPFSGITYLFIYTYFD